MSLVKQNLQNSIKAALDNAMSQNWTLDQVAAAWANAIHSYVSAAEVSGVSSSVSVSVPLNVPTPSQGTGTATQTGTVTIK
jgi:hypothetical protein